MYNYQHLKELSEQIRKDYNVCCSVNDLVALDPQNDPFYMGTEGDKEKARWFADLWDRFCDAQNVYDHIHIRRIHYWIVSQQEQVMLPNGTPYLNTDKCWKILTQASKCARYLEYVDASAFIDNRNAPPHIYTHFSPNAPIPAIEIEEVEWFCETFEFPSYLDPPSYGLRDFANEQRYLLEIWCEKSTVNDILEPMCARYGANLVIGAGEQSITSTLELVRRALVHKKPVRVLYVSDFDPAGQSMPVAVARKAEYYIKKLYPGLDLKLFPVVLTAEQVKQYRLPRTPIKATEMRKGRFEDIHGEGAVELDALATLRPDAFRAILMQHLDRYYDDTLAERICNAKEELYEALEEVRDEILEAYSEELTHLQHEHEELEQQFKTQFAEFQERLTQLQEERHEVYKKIYQSMTDRCLVIEDFPVPEPEQGDETPEPLFDSHRSYHEQICVYKTYQGKANGRFSPLLDVLSQHDKSEDMSLTA